ncbi:hypothetical protein [Mucilaginibacter ginsenosidivorax]|uniref:Uncharacterized protein n=1 Tax=Mucilaginibacter ginsenosidivorax TaxID=862126 RepID=A0A5B8VZT6_9SPHI|nr:hypothetical protein [Mucilaginibacter ginsenosidivorax]QEC76036.1 hypothetical protein FSB76_08780 [Mucilaginibacter ginsenosidivorax]
MNNDATTFKQKLSRAYLWLVPPVTMVVGFGIAPVSYKIYLPVWLLNACLIILSAYHLGLRKLWAQGPSGKQQAITALLLFMPWLLFSMFAGMGPPPSTLQGWVNTAAEQQTRYAILIAGGILLLLGAALLKTQLQATGENLYSILAFAALSIAMPLFIINMAFWGYYLTDAFRVFAANPDAKRPELYVAIKSLFYVISVAEVILMYLGTFLFAVALKITGSLSKPSARWFIGCSLIAILLELIPPSWPEPFGTAGFLVAIPAIPFVMYYLIGVRLLVR